VFTNEHTLEASYSIAYDDTIPPVYDDYNDEYDIFSPPTIEEKISYDYNMPPILMIMVMRMTMFMWGVLILLCMWLMIRMFYVIVILLILFMMLLKVIMREGNIVLCISIILSFPSLC
jgi:hypothetical protein